MKVFVGISKRRAKTLAGAVVAHDEEMGWVLFLYTVVDGKAAPLGMSLCESRGEAFEDANEQLKITDEEWVEMEEGGVENYIVDQTRNSWEPSKYKKRGKR